MTTAAQPTIVTENQSNENAFTVEAAIERQEQATRARFFRLSKFLEHTHPTKTLSKNVYGACVLSFFIPSLQKLTDTHSRLPITSKNFPNRKRILKEIHLSGMSVEEFDSLQKLADNSEALIELNPTFDNLKSLTEGQRRFQFVLRVMRNLPFMTQLLTQLKALHSEENTLVDENGRTKFRTLANYLNQA